MDWGSAVPQKQWRILPKGFWARVSLQSIRRGNVETGHEWLGGQGFPYKAGRSYFLG